MALNAAVLKVISDRTDYAGLATRLSDLSTTLTDLEADLGNVEDMPNAEEAYYILNFTGFDLWIKKLKEALDALEPLASDLKNAAHLPF